jgi:hemin uptake protein HemP
LEPEAGLPYRESSTPRITSKKLFGPARRLIIEHEGREYSLLITRQGKLVLNRSS